LRRRAVKAALQGAAAVACLMLAACGGGETLQPAPPAGPGPIVQEVPGLRVAVAAGAWPALTERVLPFLVTLRNTGERPVLVSRGDFLVLDNANRQYLPLPPAEVAALMGGGGGSGVAVSPSIGIGGSTGGGGSVFGGGLGIALGGGGGGSLSEGREIIPRALPEGPVQPGAEIVGFLYFPIPAPGYETLRFVAAPQDVPGKPRADFEFRRVK
jgi:hypothetical protein